MSFLPFEKKDLPKELKNIENTFIRYNSNILRQLTIGYQDLNEKVKSLKLGSNKIKSTAIIPVSDPNTKFLQLNVLQDEKSEYLFDHRYRFHSLVTHGGFSQIILVNDHFNQERPMILKVLKSGYHSMGIREQIILRHLSIHQSKGPHYCKTH